MATGWMKETSSNLLNFGTLTLNTVDLDPMGVVVVGDKLVITDGQSSKVFAYSRHQGMLLSSTYKLESTPRGVCCVSDTDLCVAMDDGNIAIMSVQDSGFISRNITFHLRSSYRNCFDRCHGVALWKDNIVVSGEKDDTIYWCLVSLKDGRPDNLHKVCGGRFSYLTVEQDMVYITCNAINSFDRGVYGFNLLHPFQPTYIYKHNDLLWPHGITVDGCGYLFVCDFYNKSMYQLTDTCQLVTIYKDGIPRDPWALFWDRGILYLTSWNSNVVTMYKTPEQETASILRIKSTRTRLNVPEKQYLQTKQPRHVINVKPVEPITPKLSERGIHGLLLRQLSQDLISKNWQFFFRELSVTDNEIQQIEIDFHRYGVREQIYQLLHLSYEKGIFRKEAVIKALECIGRVDLANKYKRETFPDS